MCRLPLSIGVGNIFIDGFRFDQSSDLEEVDGGVGVARPCPICGAVLVRVVIANGCVVALTAHNLREFDALVTGGAYANGCRWCGGVTHV